MEADNHKKKTQTEMPKVYSVEIKEHVSHFTRRDFLKAVGVVGAAAGLAGCGQVKKFFPTPTPKPLPTLSVTQRRACSGLLAHDGDVISLAISPDRNILASGAADHTVKLWSLSNGTLLHTLNTGEGYVESIFISPQNDLLIANRWDTIYIWSLPEAGLMRTIPLSDYANLQVSPDFKYMAAGFFSGDIELFSVPKGESVATLKGHSESIVAMAFTSDSKMLISGSLDTTLKLWSVPDGEVLQTLEGHSDEIHAIALSQDDQLLLSGDSTGTIHAWSLPKGELVSTYEGHNNQITSLAVDPNGEVFASGSSDETVKLWSLSEGTLLDTMYDHLGIISHLLVTSDGDMLLSGSYDGTINLWSLPDGKFIKSIQVHDLAVFSMAISADNLLLASGCSDGDIKLWSLPDGGLVSCLFDLEASPDTTEGMTYSQTDPDTGETITYTLPCGSDIPVGAVCTCNCVGGTN